MVDGVAKGVGEQLGQLGKQIVTEVAKAPAKIVGFDETLGSSSSGKGQPVKQQQTRAHPGEQKDPLQQLAKQDALDKQKQLAQARQLIQQFIRPDEKSAQTLEEKLELEELEKKRKEIEEERKKAEMVIRQSSSKRPRGDLFGVKAKKFGGEVGKNVKAQ